MVAATDRETPAIDEPRKLVGVTPAHAAEERRRLLGALEEAFPIRFEGREPTDLAGLDGLLVLGPAYLEKLPDDPDGMPNLCPRLVALSQSERSVRESAVIEFAGDTRVARPLRGRKLSEACCPVPANPAPLESDLVLAAAGGRPVWWCRQEAVWTHFTAFAPEELGEAEALRDHLRIGHFIGLIPLLHFLWHICRKLHWSKQPLRASFVIDDPNLHWPSYGYLDYSDMVAHATKHGYHVGLAMVPLDGWLTNRRAASLVKDNPAALSLLMHGNDHVSDELGRLTDDQEAEIVLAQALRRIGAFERRSGVTVERVMVPPHEVCSTAALRAMFRLGFDGACIGRRHPWHDHEPMVSLPSWPLIRWHPADLIAGGLPILPRYLIDRPWEDLVFRALLRQPLILFGHHWDFAQGLEVLSEATDYINGLGDVQWGSTGWIARHNFLTRCAGKAVIVQMHSRRAVVEVPDDTAVMEVRTPSSWNGRSGRNLAYGAGYTSMVHDGSEWTSGALRVVPGTQLELALAPDRPLDPARLTARRSTPWPLLRRALVEGRDRIKPLSRKVPGH